ncbi:unnamed protein product, partial [Darwinula stevensoni]
HESLLILSTVSRLRKDAQEYYMELLRFSREHLMIYPYHLQDMLVKGLRITPFQFYVDMVQELMDKEKNYDSLPNFTAADVLRLLGIGRNEYIEMMNESRGGKKLFRRGKSNRDLLPSKPKDVHIAPWWILNEGYITEQDMKMVNETEKSVIDKLIDDGPQKAGSLDYSSVHSLYQKGLVYVDVPIDSGDCVEIPPLEGFVMNRLMGDYFETLLYKVLVSIHHDSSVKEVGEILKVPESLLKRVLSFAVRMGLGVRKGFQPESFVTHTSWRHLYKPPLSSFNRGGELPGDAAETQLIQEIENALEEEGESISKRIGLLYDSTLTAYLMMGNLSVGLKNHAVTMFEVGKLSDESLGSLLEELEKVEDLELEGEAKRYMEHAVNLRSTVLALRSRGHVLDLLRCESLLNLDRGAVSRLLRKYYAVLITLCPMSPEAVGLTSVDPPLLGPPAIEANTPWWKVFLYASTELGPPSMLLARGTRLRRLPPVFMEHFYLFLTSWNHESILIPTAQALFLINDALTHAPIFVQGAGNEPEPDFHYIPIPFDEEKGEAAYFDKIVLVLMHFMRLHHLKLKSEKNGDEIKELGKVREKLKEVLDTSCCPGIISFLHGSFFDVSFGVPLFDSNANKRVCHKILSQALLSSHSLEKWTEVSGLVVEKFHAFIQSHQVEGCPDGVIHPTRNSLFANGVLSYL